MERNKFINHFIEYPVEVLENLYGVFLYQSMQEKLPVAGSAAGGFSELYTFHMVHFKNISKILYKNIDKNLSLCKIWFS